MSGEQPAQAPDSGALSGGPEPDMLLERSKRAAPHDLPALVREQSLLLGAMDATIFLADLQDVLLVPFLGPGGAVLDPHPAPLAIDATLAGRAYQQSRMTVQAADGSGGTVWLPLTDGADRLGVLAIGLGDAGDVGDLDAPLSVGLARLATVVGHLLALRTRNGDSIVVTTRLAELSLASEIQWGLLPPLSFQCREVAIAGILEPAYDVAGDSVDYAVDPGVARVAIFDGMGHGLRSAQLAALSVAAYRNARRRGCTLLEVASAIDDAVEVGFEAESYTTAVLAELDTRTGHLSWVNAGHPEPLLVRQGQLVRSLHVEPGIPFGIGLGEFGRGYAVGTDKLEPGDQVLFYTDGVVEGRSPSGEMFGVDRLVDLLSRSMADTLSLTESVRRVGRALLAHQESHLNDDATMLIVQWPPPS